MTTDTKSRILDAALALFNEQGTANVTTNHISEALGMSPGNLYYHYRNKSALFFAVQRRAMELTRAAIEPAALSGESPRIRLEKMAHAHTLLMMEHLPYLRVAAQGLEFHLSGRTTEEERAEMKAITAMRDSNEQLYIKVLQEGVAAGEFREVDTRIVVKPLLGALNWTSRWYQPRSNETKAHRERLAAEITRFAVHALLH